MRRLGSLATGGAWRLMLLVAAVAAVLALAASAAADKSGSKAQEGPQGSTAPAAGKVRYGKPVTPRHPQLKGGLRRGQPSVKGKRDPDGEPPPGLGGGRATAGLPPILSDGPPGKGRKPAVTRRTRGASGSFADLLSLTAATFSGICVVQPSGSCNGPEPPDTQMAAGTTNIVEAVNNNIFVYDRAGNSVASGPLTDIFQPPGQNVGLTDPKIVFDPSTGKFYMTEMVCQDAGCGANNWTHMGISLAISGNGTNWDVYDYVLDDTADLHDQEKLGFSGDKITFAVNEYGCKCGAGSSYKQVNIVVIQKSDAIAGNTITPARYDDPKTDSNPAYIFDSMPTTPVNASTGDNTQYVVWDAQATSNNYMKVVRITGTPNGNDVDFTGNVTKIGIGNQTAPPTPVAQGGNLAGDKQNFQSAMVQGNDLWAVATDGCTPQNDNATRDCTRLVEVDLGNNSVGNDIDIGTQGTYRINPSVSKDSDGHVFFGFTISDSSTYATAALDASGLPFPAVLQRIDFAAGDIAYGGGRWGDYSGTQQDPLDTHDVWTAQEFGGCSNQTGCNSSYTNGPIWATALGQFTFQQPHIDSISPTKGKPSGGTTVDIYGSEFANGGTTVKFGANTSPSVTWLDPGHIRAVSPAGSVGTVDITATTGAGTSDTSSADQFTYEKFKTSTTYTGDTSGDFNDQVTLSAKLTVQGTSQGVPGKTISFSVGAESCSGTTSSGGIASCQVTLGDLPGGSYSVQATFAGDVDYEASGAVVAPFTVNKEDSQLAYTGVTTSHYHDSFTASATLTDKADGLPIAGKSVTLTLGGGGGTQTCTKTTDGGGNVSCQLTPTQTGATNIVASFAGDAYYLSSGDTKSFSITPEETTMTYTGPMVILAGGSGGTTLTATLVEEVSNDPDADGGFVAPNPAEPVTITIGTGPTAQSCTGTTDSSTGNVTCKITGSITVPLGPQTVTASFAGDAYYQAATASKQAIVFAFPSMGVFTLGDLTAAAASPSTTVTWWSNNWYLLDSLSGGTAPSPFKGFVASVTLPNTTPANICSSNWSTTGGNSPPPPATVPSYMGVVVASKITKSGNTINGSYMKIAVVKTDPGYAPGPQNQGTGTIVATFCALP